jgi:hypothetical protein
MDYIHFWPGMVQMIHEGKGRGAGRCRHAGKKEGFPDFNITRRHLQ